jgi:hypothetical protein
MAYADIGDIASGAVISETYLDQIRANFAAGVPDIFTTEGDIAIATAADTAARLAVGTADSILVAGSARPEYQIVPAARVYNDAAIDPAPGNWVTLTFNTERFDTDAMHSTSTNTSRLTVPTGGDGLYLIGAHVEFDYSGATSGALVCGVRILLNGTTVIGQDYRTLATQSSLGIDMTVGCTTLYNLAATNYVEVQAFTQGDVNVLATAAYSPEFWAIWQRRP